MIDRPGTGERVYLATKAFLLSEGSLRPGERIDVRDLCRRFSASATPVRSALHRLAGERLVASLQGEGFALPRLTEPALVDLYQWNAALLVNAARAGVSEPPLSVGADLPPVAALEDLFARLAARGGNVEVEWAVAGANDRLHRARRIELELVADFAAETEEMRRLGDAGPAATLRQTVVGYHRRRLRLVPAIVRRLHGLDDREGPLRPGE